MLAENPAVTRKKEYLMEKELDPITYVILGPPRIFSKQTSCKSRRIFDSQKNERFIYAQQLANQHDDRPLFTVPIYLEATFFMPFPEYKSNNKNNIPRSAYHHFYVPNITDLVKMIEQVATGVLWNDPCIISEIDVKKVYDKSPRTEFTITILKGK